MYEKIKINLNNVEDIKRFIDIARAFESDIDVMTDRATVDGKSVLGLYALDLSQNVYTSIISDNIEECEEFKRLMEVFKPW